MNTMRHEKWTYSIFEATYANSELIFLYRFERGLKLEANFISLLRLETAKGCGRSELSCTLGCVLVLVNTREYIMHEIFIGRSQRANFN